MATTDRPLVICDTGPLIHLDELGCLDLLSNLGPVVATRTVQQEAMVHQPHFAQGGLPDVQIVDTIYQPSAKLAALADAFELDAGELSAIALMEHIEAKMFLCDDAAARLAAEALGFTVRGTIGILVRSLRIGLRTKKELLDLLHDLPTKSSLHISRRLLTSVIADVERASIETLKPET